MPSKSNKKQSKGKESSMSDDDDEPVTVLKCKAKPSQKQVLIGEPDSFNFKINKQLLILCHGDEESLIADQKKMEWLQKDIQKRQKLLKEAKEKSGKGIPLPYQLP